MTCEPLTFASYNYSYLPLKCLGRELGKVNKPPGMHCKPCAFNTNLVTLEGYLPALVQPPLTGTHCTLDAIAIHYSTL